MKHSSRNTFAEQGSLFRWDQFLRLPNTSGVPKECKEARISRRKITLPRTYWERVGSPVHLAKDVHLPTGDLHLVPASGTDATSYRVDLGDDRRVVRVYVSAKEALYLRSGSYTPEIEDVLGRTVIILRRAYSSPSWLG